MKISGFTFVRNATRLQYPIAGSIQSVLPIVDEFVVVVGDSSDETVAAVQGIGSPKIRLVPSRWNPNVNSGGYVLAQQTNIGLFNCTGEWAIYLQADEAIHERDHATLTAHMERYRHDDGVEGMLLQRVTFFGDYHTIVTAHPFQYDLACRIVKPHRFVLSRGDAAGFCVHPKYKERGRRIRAVDTGLTLFHYGDVRATAASREFQRVKGHYWAGGGASLGLADPGLTDIYERTPRMFVGAYAGPHPAPMLQRVATHSERLDLDSPRWRTSLNPPERRRYWRSRLSRFLGRRALIPGFDSAARIVKSHRTGYVGAE